MKSEKLKKIVAMAKQGIGGEQETALLLLHKICEKYDLDFDELMGIDLNVVEHTYEYKGKISSKLAVQIIVSMLGKDCELKGNSRYLYYTCTLDRAIEVRNALIQYARAYRKEQKAVNERHKLEKKVLFRAFIEKHALFPPPEENNERKEPTDEEIEEIRMAMRMTRDMDEEVSLYKQLS